MEIGDFEQVVKSLKLIRNYDFRRPQFDKGFEFPYKYFDKEIFESRSKCLEVVSHFQKICVRDLFLESYLKSKLYTSSYIDTMVVKKEDDKIYIHTKLYYYLSSYILNRLEGSIKQLLEVLESEDLDRNFLGNFHFSNGCFQYYTSKHDLVHNCLKQKVRYYEELFHFFTETTTQINISHTYIEINITGIKCLMKRKKNLYDYSLIGIKNL